ncbi:DUF362 domain-containing protein [Candidatus Woesearchaeota archaeon]|nr:DUF362 domain-containing protein [Candidatus Woesearchaeota archaeon]
MIIRWICDRCNKKWIYPVEKCVYCKGEITKQKGSKLKVVGITKVSIQSPMHPIIPYNIILLQDEFGNRMPKKTMKDYKLGDNYIQEKAKTEDAVSIAKVKYDVYEAIKETLGLLKFELSPNDKVLVKPSIIAAAYPYQAVNTDPEFFDALLKVLFELGVKKEDVVVAEQALIGSDVNDAAAKAGILEVCKKNGVNFFDISKGPFEEIESEGFSFKIFKEALNRKVINAPIMKTNFQLGFSGALENLARFADEKTQREMYYVGFDKIIAKLAKVIPNVFTIADATKAMQGQGPLASGEPAFLNLVLAGKNFAAVDAIFCEVTLLEIPPYIDAYGKCLDSKHIEVVGNEVDALKYSILPAVPHDTPHPDIKVIDGKSCPACLNLLYNLTSKLIGLRGEELNLIIGSMLTEDMLKGKERLVALGGCAIKKLQSMKFEPMAEIEENIDQFEQLVLLKKLLITQGRPKITPIDKVKSKMTKLLSKVIR